MSDQLERPEDPTWEAAVAAMAARYEFPATPSLIARRRPTTGDAPPLPLDRRSASVGRRRLAAGLALATLLLAVVLVVPDTRAAVLRFFAQIGAIRVYVDDATPLPAASSPAPAMIPPTPTLSFMVITPEATVTVAQPAPTHSLSLHDLGEPVTLEAVAADLAFAPWLPASLGPPAEVYGHSVYDAAAVTFVWRDGDGKLLSLTEIGAPEFAYKMASSEQVRELSVGGEPALWIEGPHSLLVRPSFSSELLRIESNVLLWKAGGVTYRLEGDLSMKEALALVEELVAD